MSGRRFPNDINFLEWIFPISIGLSQQFVPKGTELSEPMEP